jgi:hypothetical protein
LHSPGLTGGRVELGHWAAAPRAALDELERDIDTAAG